MSQIILAIVQALFLLVIAPLCSGVSRVLRAKIHTRKGPSIFQDYYDIFKLFKRQDVCTKDSGPVFKLMPVLFLSTMLLMAAAIPVFTTFCPLPFLGNFIVLVYLLVVPRFFLSLAAIDSSGSYPSVGGIRELLAGALVEPAIIIALFTIAVVVGTTDVGEMGQGMMLGAFAKSPIAIIVAGIAFAAACYMELGKLPYDMAEAEQELQEGPLAEYSGTSFALVKLSLTMKQLVVISLFLCIFVPYGAAAEMTPLALIIGFIVYWVKVSIVYLVCAAIENSIIRVRFNKLSKQTWIVVGCAAVSFVFALVQI